MADEKNIPFVASTTYRLRPEVTWTVETQDILVRAGKGSTHRVPYPEAALWDLISRGYRLDKVVPMMGHIASLEAETARQLVLDTLEQWTACGFFSKELSHG